MSARNGDKARFGKQRKRKMAHRARTQELRDGLKASAGTPGEQLSPAPQVPEAHSSSDSAAHRSEHGVLGSAAERIGSVFGAVAAKVKGSKAPEAEPAHAE